MKPLAPRPPGVCVVFGTTHASTSSVSDCVEPARRAAIVSLVARGGGASAFDLAAMPRQLHANVSGGWKKLIALHSAAREHDRSTLLLWQDADALLRSPPSTSLLVRARAIAALQPDVVVWIQPGLSVVRSTPSRYWSTFEGVSLAQSTVRNSVARRGYNGLQSGVMLVRATNVSVVSSVLQYYGHTEALRARGFHGGQEQGPLTHHLLRYFATRVRLVGWLQREIAPHALKELGPAPALAGVSPSFLHFSGCSHSVERKKACAAALCRSRSNGSQIADVAEALLSRHLAADRFALRAKSRTTSASGGSGKAARTPRPPSG